MRVSLLSFLLSCLLSCLLLSGCAHMRVTERQIIRPDAPGTVADKRYGGKGTGLVVAAQGDALLKGILVEQPGADRTVLYFGGNMFHIDQHLATLLPGLAACGANIAVFDYRGYGRSSGTPTVETLQAARWPCSTP